MTLPICMSKWKSHFSYNMNKPDLHTLFYLSYGNTAVPVSQVTTSFRHPWPPWLYICSITKFYWFCLQNVYPVKWKSTSTHHLRNYHICSHHYRLSKIFSYFPFYSSSFFLSQTHCLLHNVWWVFFTVMNQVASFFNIRAFKRFRCQSKSQVLSVIK